MMSEGCFLYFYVVFLAPLSNHLSKTRTALSLKESSLVPSFQRYHQPWVVVVEMKKPLE